MAIILESSQSVSVTAADLILRAHRILGNKASGATLNANEKDDGLEALNSMLDSFSIDRLLIYQIQQETFTWPANTVSRTIGTTGDFATDRPPRIWEGTFFRDSSNIDYPVTITRNRETYDAITDKTVTSSYPELLFYDTGMPTITLYTYPIATQSLTFLLNSWKALTVFYTLAQEVELPPGYKRMLSYNLALELEAEVGLPLSDNARQIAISSKKSIKRMNNLPIYSSTETFHVLSNRRRGHDIYAGN